MRDMTNFISLALAVVAANAHSPIAPAGVAAAGPRTTPADLPTTVAVAGRSQRAARLFTELSRAEDGCRFTILDDGRPVGPGPFRVTLTQTPDETGTWLICAQLFDGDGEVLATSERVMRVRPPRVTLGRPLGPRRVRVGSLASFTVAGATEVERWLLFSLMPPGQGCAGQYGSDFFDAPGGSVTRPGRFSRTFTVRPDRPGVWTLCTSAGPSSGETEVWRQQPVVVLPGSGTA